MDSRQWYIGILERVNSGCLPSEISGLQYYFNELDAGAFQRLVNAILVARFGEALRAQPLYGADGGQDAIADVATYEAVAAGANPLVVGFTQPPRPGRYIFQAKHHRTINADLPAVRHRVITEFQGELKKNVLPRANKVDHFILITNVPTTEITEQRVAEIRKRLERRLHVDIWWEADLIARLDQLPFLWHAFPQMFAGGRVPVIASISSERQAPRQAGVLRRAIGAAYATDRLVKFRQIELERDLARLFVDIGIRQTIQLSFEMGEEEPVRPQSAMSILLRDGPDYRRVLLEGGPGQGKSTLTQMVAQVYRQQVLKRADFQPEKRWQPPKKARIPIRIELRPFSQWLLEGRRRTLDEYLAEKISSAAAEKFTVRDLHVLFVDSPVILILDGLDEVGSDELRNRVVHEILATEGRCGAEESADVRFILTTRPPALEGRRAKFDHFTHVQLASLGTDDVGEYVRRWTDVQLEPARAAEVRKSFDVRRRNPHVAALSRNPMQLAVLLHFIDLRGEAFPDRRADLYREYFKTVIDRDVEKNEILHDHRDLVEALHAYLGFTIHALIETQESNGALARRELLRLTDRWLRSLGGTRLDAETLFRLGEERLGLIVSVSGEGSAASYGFDIQPTREYFAAAYISDHVVGDPHEIFMHLVPRAYWREVAIFVAGLRRPREKADLLERLRLIDQNPEYGWRSFGRRMMLDLIEGGVFDDPEYLYEAAVLFVLEAFDRERVPYVHRDLDLARRVGFVLRHTHLRVVAEIERLLEDRSASPDVAEVECLVRLAVNVLPERALRMRLMAAEPASGEVRVLARTVWPIKYKIGLGQHKNPQAGTDAVAWAFQAIRAAALDLRQVPAFPPELHELLIEQYVFGYVPLRKERLEIPRTSHLVWALMAIDQWIRYGKSIDLEFSQSDLKAMKACGAAIDVEGLPQPVAAPLSQLFGEAQEILAALVRLHERRQLTKHLHQPGADTRSLASLTAKLERTKRHLTRPGIVSAAAARITLSLLDLLPATRSSPVELRSVRGLGSWWNDQVRIDAIRVRPGVDPVPLAAALLRQSAGQLELPLLDRIPVPAFVLQDLFDVRSGGGTAMTVVESHRLIPGPAAPHLPPLASKQIFDLVKNKDIKGHLAIPRLMEWMQNVSPSHTTTVASACQSDHAGAHAAKVFAALAEPVALATLVHSDPDSYATAYTAHAAQIESESLPIKLPPLMALRKDLGLHERFDDV